MEYPGDFLVLAYNESFDYWMLLKMKHRITNKNLESVNYEPLGKYTIASSPNRLAIEKEEKGYTLTYGGNTKRNSKFDPFNTRKKAYKFSMSRLLAQKNRFNNKKGTISGKDIVKIYNKKRT